MTKIACQSEVDHTQTGDTEMFLLLHWVRHPRSALRSAATTLLNRYVHHTAALKFL